MIIQILHSQLGNQMFQYAFGFSTAKRFNTFSIPFNIYSHSPFLLIYFKLDFFTILISNRIRLLNKIHRYICRMLISRVLTDKIVDPESELIENIKDNVVYEGYFQSEKYFLQNEIDIKKKFTIKNKFSSQFNLKYSNIFSKNKTLVIHFRRKDYNEFELESLGGKGYVLPLNYYYKSLDTISNIDSYEVFFIGDDVNSIKLDFEQKNNFHFEENSEIIDFQLIQNADVAIIANSTFAWWAAYLSLKPNARIIAPKYWLGFKVDKTFPPFIETSKFVWMDY